MVVLVMGGVLHAGVTQRWLIEGSSLVDLLSITGTGKVLLPVLPLVLLVGLSREVVPQEIVGRRALEPQGPRKRPPPLCEVETTRVGVQICPSARQPVTRIRNKLGERSAEIVPDRHDA
jgi:hypothetical protein